MSGSKSRLRKKQQAQKRKEAAQKRREAAQGKREVAQKRKDDFHTQLIEARKKRNQAKQEEQTAIEMAREAVERDSSNGDRNQAAVRRREAIAEVERLGIERVLAEREAKQAQREEEQAQRDAEQAEREEEAEREPQGDQGTQAPGRRPSQTANPRTDTAAPTDGPTEREVALDEVEGMFDYMRDAGFADRIPPDQTPNDILNFADRGDQLLDEIIFGDREKVETSSLEHAENIRAISWSLYRKAFRKGQGLIGGMIVLEDNGRLKRYLKQGNESSGKPGGFIGRLLMQGKKTVSYYKRGFFERGIPGTSTNLSSSHYFERRDDSLGMDFRGFLDSRGKKHRIKLPLEKSHLHFGTLDEGQRTFIKFEYFGMHTLKDTIGHALEFRKKNVAPEIGHREDVKKNLVRAIQKVLEDAGIDEKDREQITVGGKTFTAKKSGLHFARLVTNNRITDPVAKVIVQKRLEAILDNQFIDLEDGKFVKDSKKAMKDAGISEVEQGEILSVGKDDNELTSEKWLENVQIRGLLSKVKLESKKDELLKRLRTILRERFETLTDNFELRQGDEVILTRREIMSPKKRGQERWADIRDAVDTAKSKQADSETQSKTGTTLLKRMIGERKKEVNQLKKELEVVLDVMKEHVDAYTRMALDDEMDRITVNGREFTQEELGRLVDFYLRKTNTLTSKLTARLNEKKDGVQDFERRLGNPANWMGERGVEAHLQAFKDQGVHAFINPTIHEKIQTSKEEGGFGGWGLDRNFVAPKGEAAFTLEEVEKQDGIVALEKALGIPPGSWVKASRTEDGRYLMKRYIVDPENMDKVDLKMARGDESSAYDNEFIAGGQTPQDINEATIRNFVGNQLETAIKDGTIKIEEVDLTEQTRKGIESMINRLRNDLDQLENRGEGASEEATKLRASKNEWEIIQMRDKIQDFITS